MENITIKEFTDIHTGETKEAVVIDKGNGDFSWMPKSVWDELEAAKEAQSLQIMSPLPVEFHLITAGGFLL